MKSMITTKGCGKLMIAGEYSVLFGHQALIATINKSAISTFIPATTSTFVAKMGPIRSLEPHLFNAVFASCEEHGFAKKPGNYLLDTSSFFNDQTGQKFGLGSSAAATVALVKTILCQHGIEDQSLLLNIALLAHRAFSKGLGSGADVAASVFSQAILYRCDNDCPIIAPVDIKSLLDNLVFVDTGVAQNTRPFVERVLTLAKLERSFLTQFSKSSSALCDALILQNDIHKQIGIIRQLYALLHQLGTIAGIDIISAPHERIHHTATYFGGSAKPSGAGGGDIALALVPLEKRAAFKKTLVQQGFSLISLRSGGRYVNH